LDHEHIEKTEKDRLLPSYFFQKTVQGEITLEGKIINYAEWAKGFLDTDFEIVEQLLS
jgi:hypothetical protein